MLDGQGDKIYGLIPVLEALRAGQRAIDSITIAEGARHGRLRDLLALAKQANVPVHRVPRISLDRSLKETMHQGVVAGLLPPDTETQMNFSS
jgi:23S rRNA (guanosine2251-2'-O)-methyltransferase